MSELSKIVDQLSKLTLLEAAELTKLLEDKWGVLPMQNVAVPSGSANNDQSTSSKKDSFKVVIKSIGDKKIAVIKAIKEITNLTLKDAKNIIDSLPGIVKENVSKKDAEKYKAMLTGAGANVELK